MYYLLHVLVKNVEKFNQFYWFMRTIYLKCIQSFTNTMLNLCKFSCRSNTHDARSDANADATRPKQGLQGTTAIIARSALQNCMTFTCTLKLVW